MLTRTAAAESFESRAADRAAGESTFRALVTAIAEEVAEKVRSEVGAYVQQVATRVQPTLLNVKDAAIYLGRSEQAIQHLIFERQLPVIRVGRRVHLDRRDLDAWIEKNRY